MFPWHDCRPQGNKWMGTQGSVTKFDGVHWTVFNLANSGLPDEFVYSIAVDSRGNKWIATWNGGLAVYREGGVILTGIEEQPKAGVPQAFAQFQNYPNPFNPTTVISYQLPVVSDARLTVYDVLGQEVATLVNEVKEPGTYTVRWDATGLASGVYLYRLQAGSFVDTKRMLLLR